ncbi:hypothetical protein [Acidisoma sp. C75]
MQDPLVKAKRAFLKSEKMLIKAEEDLAEKRETLQRLRERALAKGLAPTPDPLKKAIAKAKAEEREAQLDLGVIEEMIDEELDDFDLMKAAKLMFQKGMIPNARSTTEAFQMLKASLPSRMNPAEVQVKPGVDTPYTTTAKVGDAMKPEGVSADQPHGGKRLTINATTYTAIQASVSGIREMAPRISAVVETEAGDALTAMVGQKVNLTLVDLSDEGAVPVRGYAMTVDSVSRVGAGGTYAVALSGLPGALRVG